MKIKQQPQKVRRTAQAIVTDMEKRWNRREMRRIFMMERNSGTNSGRAAAETNQKSKDDEEMMNKRAIKKPDAQGSKDLCLRILQQRNVQRNTSYFHDRMKAQKEQDSIDEDEGLAVVEGFNGKFLAKGAALQVWSDNSAWRPVPESEAGEGECVPARFLQRWKPTKDGHKANANARIIAQGFKRKDVLESKPAMCV